MTGTTSGTANGEPRRHHYVPRCWLAGFTDTGKKDGTLWVTDFKHRKQREATPGSVGFINDFYRLSEPAPNPVVVEKFFSILEEQVAPLLKSIDRDHRRPTPDELDGLLQFMAYQWVRVPKFRPFAFQIMERVTREKLAEQLQSRDSWLAEMKRAEIDPDTPGADYDGMKRFFDSGEWNITVETDWYMQRAFKDADGVLDCLRKRYWGLSFTHQGRLIASDNPVVLEGDKGQMVGFKNAEFVLYPLSRHAFLTGVFDNTRKPVHNFKYFASMNTMMLLNADVQVFSHVPDFSWRDEDRQHQTDWTLFSKEKY